MDRHKRVLVSFSPAFLAVLDHAAEKARMTRSEFLESRMSRLAVMKNAAYDLGVNWPAPRRGRGGDQRRP